MLVSVNLSEAFVS